MILYGFNRQASSHGQGWISNIDFYIEKESDGETRRLLKVSFLWQSAVQHYIKLYKFQMSVYIQNWLSAHS